MEVAILIGCYVIAAVCWGVILGSGSFAASQVLGTKSLRVALRAESSAVDKLLHDGKFLTALFDAVTTIMLFIVATYYPQYDDMVKVVWGAMQPVFLLIIAQVSNMEAKIATLAALVKSKDKE